MTTLSAFVVCLLVSVIAASSVAENYQRSEVELDATGNVASSSTCNALAHSTWTAMSLQIHRNGDPDACEEATSSLESFEKALQELSLCDKEEPLDKYQVETLLTTVLLHSLSSCGPTDNETAGFKEFCDMGPNRTVIQEDHESIVRTPMDSLPCRFFTREGLRITSLNQLADLQQTKQQECAADTEDETCHKDASTTSIHLYAVPNGRVFMFASSFVGERFEIKHVSAPSDAPIVVETISLSPRVFEIINFYSPAEADELIEKALNETSETMGLHRSTTGAINGVINSKRTSENAWDQAGKTAVRLKKRCLETLGFDEYQEIITDGLQVLRYRNNQAYNSHPDYLSDVPNHWFNYDSSGVGTNRFATILLYMSDVDENAGGETMFMNAWPHDAPEEIRSMTFQQELDLFRATEDAALFEEGSWEESLTAMCRTRLSVKPRKGKAVLFYSQMPNSGEEDKMAIHGACPVMRNNTKWAANLWVWNGPRAESKVAPRKWPPTEDELKEGKPQQVVAYFYNSLKDPAMDTAELYYGEGTFWAKLGPDESAGANTFKGHEWTVQVNGEVIKRFVITDEAEQSYHI